MTSAISPPRRLLALCSPSTQRTASTMLLLPLPFGPTTAVIPVEKSNCVLSAKLLKPTNSSLLSMRHPCAFVEALGVILARFAMTRSRVRWTRRRLPT